MTRRGLVPALAALLAAAPAHADDSADIVAARKFAEPVMSGQCDFENDADGRPGGYNNVFRFAFRARGQDQDSPDLKRTLVQLACSSGAYNYNSIYVMRDDDAGGWTLLAFAEPVADYDYADENFSKLKAPPKVSGYVTVTELTNSEYAAETRTITAFAKWRGIGDAWSGGVWQFDNGVFVLRKYEIDPTYQPPGDAEQDPEAPESYVLFDTLPRDAGQ
ncbi:MAG: DUF1176 domain-containing protein [Rhizobiaceae bacterium]|nr:DUF1176 domain-containing protein [Rhizobiaceae bacterium]